MNYEEYVIKNLIDKVSELSEEIGRISMHNSFLTTQVRQLQKHIEELKEQKPQRKPYTIEDVNALLGDNKIQAIKAVRTLLFPAYSLQAAKSLVERFPRFNK